MERDDEVVERFLPTPKNRNNGLEGRVKEMGMVGGIGRGWFVGEETEIEEDGGSEVKKEEGGQEVPTVRHRKRRKTTKPTPLATEVFETKEVKEEKTERKLELALELNEEEQLAQ